MAPRVLVIDSDVATKGEVRAYLSSAFPALELVEGLEPIRGEIPPLPDVDVSIVHLTDAGGSELRVALDHAQAVGASSAVLWADSPRSPQVAAALALGIERILRAHDLIPWIDKALPALVRHSRARRALERSLREIPPIPQWANEDTCHPVRPLALPQAETLFRESYVRHLLANTQSRKRAAEIAGVPYRTFCDILKKLDIR